MTRRGNRTALRAPLRAAITLSLAAGLTAPSRAQSVDRRPSLARSEVRALARLEPESGVISVGARPGTRVEKILATEGQDVKAGDLLAVLEGRDQRDRQLALAQAQKAAADFKRALRREELALEREAFDRLKQTRLDGLRKLVADLKSKVGPDPKDNKDGKPATDATPPASGLGQGMVPPVVRDAAAAQLRSELVKAEVQLKELEVSLDLLARRRALEDRQVADDSPELAVLDRQIDLAKAEAAQSRVEAPSAGRVLLVSARPGEVTAGPLLTMGDVRTMVARAEVFQSDVPEVAVGDPAEVTILGRRVAGEVTRVGALVARNAIQSLDPTALSDRRVVEVIVRLADPAPASGLVNMQVEVSIRKRNTAAAAR